MENRRYTLRKTTKTHDTDLVFGMQPVMETLRSGKEIERLFIQKDTGAGEVQKLAAELGIPYLKVPVEKLNRITRKNHQGVICFVSPIRYAPIHNVLTKVFEEGNTPLFLILDRVTDVRNFGGIARSAECAGVQGIVVPQRGGAQITSDAMKTSSGALNFVSVCRENSLAEAVRYLKESGLRIVACTEKSEKLLYQADFSVPTAIIMGSEEDGISRELLELSDDLVKIPLMGKVGSLNVSAATAVILYETVRQRIG